MNTKHFRSAVFLCFSTLILAIAAHIYLAQVHYEIKFSSPGAAHTVCNVNETFNCAATSASQYAELIGTEIPMAVLGAFASLGLLVLLAYYLLFLNSEKKLRYYPNLLIYSAGIAATSLVMAFFSSAILHTYCLVCMFTYLLSFLNLFGVYLLKPDSRVQFQIKSLSPLVIAGLATLILSIMINQSIRRGHGYDENMQDAATAYIKEWQQLSAVTIVIPAPLIKGASPEKAIMTIIEFADYLCPHCKHASPTLDAFVSSHPDVQFIFSVWPLDGACNSSVQHSDGTRCGLARAVYCAEKAHLGWQAHDWIFEHQESFSTSDALPKDLAKMCEDYKLNCSDLSACMDSPEAKAAIEKNTKAGTDLKIEGTPTIFVNGRKLTGGQILSVLQETYSLLKKTK
jgi:protein-disulfide isomerase/uncharacterized membrane protein